LQHPPELINGLKRNDEKAYRQCYDLYCAMVYNTSLSFLQNETDAEDVMQEVFVEVFRSIKNFKEESSLSTWIYRITINKCIDFSAHKKRKKRFTFITGLYQKDSGEPVTHPKNFEHPGVQMENRELAKILFTAIEQLPEKQKVVFILSKIEGQSQKEIVAIMQMNEKAIESLLQRAKARLRDLLGSYYDEHYKK